MQVDFTLITATVKQGKEYPKGYSAQCEEPGKGRENHINSCNNTNTESKTNFKCMEYGNNLAITGESAQSIINQHDYI